MDSLDSYRGRERVVIDRVLPEIDGGLFPIKRVVQEKVAVKAHIFADGHDQIRAELLYKSEPAHQWNASEMECAGNDEWTASFRVTQIGTSLYTVRAWIDGFRTWQEDIRKKLEAEQDVSVDLLIGADLLEHISRRASEADAARLRQWSEIFSKPGRNDKAIKLALGKEITTLADKYPDRSRASKYLRELKVSVGPARALFSSWYELFPRSCGSGEKHGTFRDCERLLPDISKMGFDVLYLPPIHPIGITNRKGRNNSTTCEAADPGSPWAIGSSEGGHKHVSPKLGTIKDFRALLASARKYEMEIALDLAFQCSPDHPYVKEHPEWFRWRPDNRVQYAENQPKKYEDIIPLNFQTENWRELWQELKGVVIFWIRQGVRVYRVDNPHTKPFAFWQWLIAEIKKEFSDVIFLAEAFTRPKRMYRLAKAGFDQSYTYFTWRNTKLELEQYFTELTATGAAEYFRANLWPNTPDILPEYLQYGGRAAFITRLILAATLSSNYGIYGPAFESCADKAAEGREEYRDSEKYEIKNWQRNGKGNIRAIIARVNRARRENSSLQQTRNLRFHEIDNNSMICYSKASDDLSNITITVVNLDPFHRQSGWILLPLDEMGVESTQPYLLHDQLSNDKYVWEGQRNYLELDPQVMPAHILRLHKSLRREADFDYFM